MKTTSMQRADRRLLAAKLAQIQERREAWERLAEGCQARFAMTLWAVLRAA